MILKLDTIGNKGAIDVQGVRRISLQAMPTGGAPSSAVLEVKRAFGDQSPSVSFSTAQTITLDGTAITEIDVTDTAWLHLVCTTAESGISVDLEYTTGGPMRGQAYIVDLDATETGVRGTLDVSGSSRAFVLAEAHGDTNSSAFEIKRAAAPGFNAVSFSSAVNLTIDGSTITEIDTLQTATLLAVCGTSQASQRLSLWVYRRDELPGDDERGAVFPFPARDGQRFTRTDLGGETFYWDATRSKWLGVDLVQITSSQANAASSGNLSLRAPGGVQYSSSRGHFPENDMTIVGVEFFSAVTFTGDITWVTNGTATGLTLYSTTQRYGSDHTLNMDFSAVATWPPQFLMVTNITSGSCNNPVVTVYMRRNGTGL